MASIGVSAEFSVVFPAMEVLGVHAPPPLEDFDDFMRSLQSCPTNLLLLVMNGLGRYIDDVHKLGKKKGLDPDQIRDLGNPYLFRSLEVGKFIQNRATKEKLAQVAPKSRRQVVKSSRKVESRDNVDGESSRGGRRDSGGGAPVASSTSVSSGFSTASFAKNAEFLGKPRKRRSNRRKIKFVKTGTKVVVRRWADGAEFGPFDVETAGQYYLRVRNPVSGKSGRLCRKRFGTFDWRPPRASRSVDLESGEGCRSGCTPRGGAWSCPGWRPFCCGSVCGARIDPGPWFGPVIGRSGAPYRHTLCSRRSS